eukprot:5836673-Prymnesium_polylepis.1
MRRAIDAQTRSHVCDRRALRRKRRRIFEAATYRRCSSSRCSMATPNRFDTAGAEPPGRAGGTLTRPTVDGGRGGAVKGVGAPTGATTVDECTPPVDDD